MGLTSPLRISTSDPDVVLLNYMYLFLDKKKMSYNVDPNKRTTPKNSLVRLHIILQNI